MTQFLHITAFPDVEQIQFRYYFRYLLEKLNIFLDFDDDNDSCEYQKFCFEKVREMYIPIDLIMDITYVTQSERSFPENEFCLKDKAESLKNAGFKKKLYRIRFKPSFSMPSIIVSENDVLRLPIL